MDKKRENDQFEFDLNAKRVRITESEMIGSLQQFYEIVKRPFTTQEYDNWDGRICTSQAIFRRFGTWRKALMRIGVSSGIHPRTYTTEELMDNLEIIWRELGYPPRQANAFETRL
jgi:hypothetical protein